MCKETFLDVSSVVAHLLEKKSSGKTMVRETKKVVEDELRESAVRTVDATKLSIAESGAAKVGRPVSYASAVSSIKPKVHVSRRPTVEVQASTSFLVVP